MVVPVLLLQERVAQVLLIGQHLPDSHGVPLSTQNASEPSPVQIDGQTGKGFSLQSPAEHLPHYRGLFRVNGHAALGDAVAEQETQVNQFTIFKGFSHTPLLVLAG